MLLDLLPDAGKFTDLVQVVDVPAAACGACAHVVADAETRRGICFLD